MHYPTQVLQYGPTEQFTQLLGWMGERNLFRELDPATQLVIGIAQEPLSFEELFFQILLFRIWNEPEVWAALKRAGPINLHSFDFGAAMAGLPKKPISRKVTHSHWCKAGWTSVPSHPDAEFHFRALAQMMEEDLPNIIKEEAKSISDIVKLLRCYSAITEAVAPTLALDLSYTPWLNLPYDGFLALTNPAKEAIAACFLGHGKKYTLLIRDVWASLDDCFRVIAGQPAPQLEGCLLSLQNLQWAFHDFHKKNAPTVSIMSGYVLPPWWGTLEPAPERREIEVVPDVPAPPYRIVSDLAGLIPMFEDLLEPGNLAFDIETFYADARITQDGQRMLQAVGVVTDRYRSSIRLLQFYRDGAELVWLVDLMKLGSGFKESEECEVLRQLFLEKTIVGHNVVCFDLPWVWEHLRLLATKILDTYIAHRILLNGLRDSKHDLKTCFRDIALRLPKDSGSSDWGTPELTKRQLCYAAHDVRHMHELMRWYEVHIDEPATALRTCWNLECTLAPVVVDLINRGVAVNLTQLPTIQARAEARLVKLEALVKGCLGAPELNINAPAQLLKALQTKGYRYRSTAEKMLILDGGQAAQLVLAYRHVKNRELKFLAIVQKAVRENGRVHSIYDQLGTMTGRFASKNPNLQNLPRPDKKHQEKSVRSLFVASPGHKLVIADFSQMELVVAACVVGETNMLAALHSGEDLHKGFAAFVSGRTIKELADTDRNLGKSCNFGLLYGQSACGGKADYPDGGLRGFARNKYGVMLTVEEAIRCRDLWFQMYPKFAEYHRECWRKAEAFAEQGFGYVRTLGVGRLQYFMADTDGEGKVIRPLLKHQIFSSLANTPIQGSSAEIFKLVLLKLTEQLPQVRIVNIVHDEIISEAAERDAGFVKAQIERIIVEATREIFPNAPMRAEITICDNWAQK
jgi:DNA polymerase I